MNVAPPHSAAAARLTATPTFLGEAKVAHPGFEPKVFTVIAGSLGADHTGFASIDDARKAITTIAMEQNDYRMVGVIQAANGFDVVNLLSATEAGAPLERLDYYNTDWVRMVKGSPLVHVEIAGHFGSVVDIKPIGFED